MDFTKLKNLDECELAIWIYETIKNDHFKEDGSIYIYNEERKLWTDNNIGRYDSLLRLHVGKMLTSVISQHEVNLEKMGLIDEKFYRFKKKIKSLQSITSISKMAKDIITKRNVVVNFKDNIKPNLFPIKDGKVINLKNGVVRDRTREDNFFEELPVEFLDETPHADKFFGSLMKFNEDMIEVLQTISGYAMTGETNEKAFFVLYGSSGDNGKSTYA